MWGKKETIAEWSLALGRCYYHTQTNTHVVHKNTGLTKKRMSRLQSYILKMLDGEDPLDKVSKVGHLPLF